MPLNIAIAGAGIGGLTAAIGLARNGHMVTMYERLRGSGGVGFSFRLLQNSDRCLRYLGIDPRRTGAVMSNKMNYFAADGRLLREYVTKDDGRSENPLFSGYVSRSALSEDLERTAIEAGARLETNVKVKAVNFKRNALVFEDGREVVADLIIGADGLHSPVRRSFVEGSRAEPHCSVGQNCFRFMIAMSKVQSDPDTASISPTSGITCGWFGKGKHIIAYPIDFGDTFSVACTHPAALSDEVVANQDADTAAAYNKKVSLEAVLDIYSDFESRIHSLLKLADPDGFRVWKLEDLDDIGSWSRGRTVLIGDAAHATLPGAFAGAGMAIEDGVTLSILLDSQVPVNEVEERLRLLEELRKPRIDRIRYTGRNQEAIRDSSKDFDDYLEFLFDYDAVTQARLAVGKHSDHP